LEASLKKLQTSYIDLVSLLWDGCTNPEGVELC
jgi:diketogulonate reductase-like aldo/keto reductase